MEELISIIVPVYNSESYIGGCIESVLNQTYPYFEVILADDGSKDKSRDLCESFCRKDERVRLLNLEHRGVSAARNRAMEAARGEYLFFLDSDDVIHPQLLEALLGLLRRDHAAIATETRFYAGGGAFRKPTEWRQEEDCTGESMYLDCDAAIDYRNFGSPETTLYVIGGKLISRNALGQVRFNEKLTHGEDTLFLYELIAAGGDVSVLKRDWYYYRIHEGGITSVFSVPTCKSRHRVNRYIRNREIKSGRRENALRWEGVILNALMKWYEIGRRERDTGLAAYAKRLGNAEVRSGLFSDMAVKKRVNFYITMYGFRLHQIISAGYRAAPFARRIWSKVWTAVPFIYQAAFICQVFLSGKKRSGE
ncbi:MAG: glycosyltransferase family 2 protein [Hungatella sp.]|nr:glycosyltransferase family 2 protein [Hungatella sp.]